MDSLVVILDFSRWFMFRFAAITKSDLAEGVKNFV